MADPILDAHSLLPRLYLLGSPLTPISIRDQMLRARWTVDRLVQNGELREGTRVLIVGAGAAGATAAIRAAEHHAHALLVEQSGGAFGVQARSATRWIDPTQYDWPAAHWTLGAYHWRPPPMPLVFPAQLSHRLARHWDTLLHTHIARLRPRLAYQPNMRVVNLSPVPGPGLSATLARGTLSFTLPFDIVIWAVGFGIEKTSIPDASGGTILGPPFWSTDAIEKPHCGFGFNPDVLILGSGDGALQDFLRAATQLSSASEVCRKLSVPEKFRHAAQDIEAQFHRGLVWCHRDEDERRLYEVRHTHYEQLVDELWKDTDFVARARSLLRSDVNTLAMGYPTTYLTGFYGLNCFLALILGRAWAERARMHRAAILRAGWRARHGQWMTNYAGPSYCDVTVDRQPGCPFPGAPATDTWSCHLLIIRLGIDPTSAKVPFWNSLTLPPPSRPRHLFPYHLPG